MFVSLGVDPFLFVKNCSSYLFNEENYVGYFFYDAVLLKSEFCHQAPPNMLKSHHVDGADASGASTF